MPVDFSKITAMREKRQLTQDEAARAAGMKTRQQWYAIESGRRPRLSVDTLEKIATALGVPPCELLTPDPHAKPRKR